MGIPVLPPPGLTVAAAHTYKARGVVVPDGLGVPESLQHRVCLDDLILQGPLTQRETQGVVASQLLPGDPGFSNDSGLCARSQEWRLGNQNWRRPGKRAIHCLMIVPTQPLTLEGHLVDNRP